MMKIVSVVLAACAIGLAGCEPIPAFKDSHLPPQVSVTDYWLQGEIRVTVLPPQRVGNGQLRVPIQVFNATGYDLSLDYQYWFVDKNGAQVDNPPNWEHIRIAPTGYEQIAPTSISAAAEDFRVQFRHAK